MQKSISIKNLNHPLRRIKARQGGLFTHTAPVIVTRVQSPLLTHSCELSIARAHCVIMPRHGAIRFFEF